MGVLRSLPALLAAAGLVSGMAIDQATKRSPKPVKENGKYIVTPDTAEFDNNLSFSFDGSSLPGGLSASDYTVGSSPLTHSFSPSNVVVSGGYMQLNVPGGQTASPIGCSEVSTDVSNILYASVRTVAVLSDPAGVCNGKSLPVCLLCVAKLTGTRDVLLQG
jgi:hypothetical protein